MTVNILDPTPIGNPPDDLLTVREAAALLSMSQGWLYGSGIPFVRLGRSRRYRRRDILSYIESHLSGPRKGGTK